MSGGKAAARSAAATIPAMISRGSGTVLESLGIDCGVPACGTACSACFFASLGLTALPPVLYPAPVLFGPGPPPPLPLVPFFTVSVPRRAALMSSSMDE